MFGILYYRASEEYLNEATLGSSMNIAALFSRKRLGTHAATYDMIKHNDALKDLLSVGQGFSENGWPQEVLAYCKIAFEHNPQRNDILALVISHGFNLLGHMNGSSQLPISLRARELHRALVEVGQGSLPINESTKIWVIMNSYVVLFKQQLLASIADLFFDLQERKLITPVQAQEGVTALRMILQKDFLVLSNIVHTIHTIEEKK